MRCHFTDHRVSATSAERRARGFGLFAGTRDGFPLSSPRLGRGPRGRRSAVRAGYRVSSNLTRCQPPSPARGEGGGRPMVGCVREAAPPLRGALLVLFSRQGEKSTHVNLPDKAKFEARRDFSAGFFYVRSMISLSLQRYTSNTPVCFPLSFSIMDAGFFSFSSMAARVASSSGS